MSLTVNKKKNIQYAVTALFGFYLQSTVKCSEKGFHLIVLKTGHSGLRGVYDSLLASFVLELKDIHDIQRATPTNAFGTLKQIARPEGNIISKIDSQPLTYSLMLIHSRVYQI